MIKIKSSGVNLAKLHPVLLAALVTASEIFRTVARVDCIVTSGDDGVHRDGSLHYQGLALDLRSKHVSLRAEKTRIRQMLRDAFPGLRVILEKEGLEQEHFHLEWNPAHQEFDAPPRGEIA